MKEKRILQLCSIILAILTVLVSAASCTAGDPAGTEENETTGRIEETGDGTPSLKINGVKLEDYTIIYNTKTASNAEDAFYYLNLSVQKEYGISLDGLNKRESDTLDKDVFSIVIGLDGGEEQIKSEYAKCDDAFIGVSGKTVYILGKDLISLKAAINDLLARAEGAGAAKSISISGNNPVKVDTEQLKVMTYNVLYDLNKEGRPSNCLELMVETIRQQDPDVFGTQENQSLASLLPEYTVYYGPGSNAPDYIYWKTDKFNLIKKGYYFMSNTPKTVSKLPGSNQNRAFSYVILEYKDSGKRFVYVDVHTDYRAEESVRKEQLSILTSLLSKVNPDGLPIVFGGDFNATPTAASITSFLAANKKIGMTSKVAEKKGNTGGTLVVSGFTTVENYVFDYLFVSTNNIRTKYYSVIVNFKDGKAPSDHLPVYAELELCY